MPAIAISQIPSSEEFNSAIDFLSVRKDKLRSQLTSATNDTRNQLVGMFTGVTIAESALGSLKALVYKLEVTLEADKSSRKALRKEYSEALKKLETVAMNDKIMCEKYELNMFQYDYCVQSVLNAIAFAKSELTLEEYMN